MPAPRKHPPLQVRSHFQKHSLPHRSLAAVRSLTGSSICEGIRLRNCQGPPLGPAEGATRSYVMGRQPHGASGPGRRLRVAGLAASPASPGPWEGRGHPASGNACSVSPHAPPTCASGIQGRPRARSPLTISEQPPLAPLTPNGQRAERPEPSGHCSPFLKGPEPGAHVSTCFLVKLLSPRNLPGVGEVAQDE